MSRQKVSVTKEVWLAKCDLCGEQCDYFDVCYGCGRDCCGECHKTMYPNPFEGIIQPPDGLVVCNDCDGSVDEVQKKVKESLESHYALVESVRRDWIESCKKLADRSGKD